MDGNNTFMVIFTPFIFDSAENGPFPFYMAMQYICK